MLGNKWLGLHNMLGCGKVVMAMRAKEGGGTPPFVAPMAGLCLSLGPGRQSP